MPLIDNEVQFVDAKGLAKVLAISHRTVQDYQYKGKFPKSTYIKIGRNIRYNVKEVVRFFKPKD